MDIGNNKEVVKMTAEGKGSLRSATSTRGVAVWQGGQGPSGMPMV